MRVQRLAVEQQHPGEFGGPARFDETKVTTFVGSINLIPDNGVTHRGEMHANLVRPARLRPRPHEGKAAASGGGGGALEASRHVQMGEGGGAIGVNALLEPDRRGLARAQAEQRGVHREFVPRGPAVDEGEVFLVEAVVPPHHRQTEVPCGRGRFGHEQ